VTRSVVEQARAKAKPLQAWKVRLGEGGDIHVRQLLIRVLAVLALDRPELAFVRLATRSMPLSGAAVQLLPDGRRNFLKAPDALQLGP
jgi:hypothetical protein